MMKTQKEILEEYKGKYEYTIIANALDKERQEAIKECKFIIDNMLINDTFIKDLIILEYLFNFYSISEKDLIKVNDDNKTTF